MASVPATVHLPPRSKAFNEEAWVREHEERAYFERKRGMQPLRLFSAGLPRVDAVDIEWWELVERLTNAWDGHIVTPFTSPQQVLNNLLNQQLLVQANPYVGPPTPYQQAQAFALSPGHGGSLGGLPVDWWR